ncbi:MAG: rod-binding protein [Phycisphaerae bacterium]|jgi:Rod binding domain-containing protein
MMIADTIASPLQALRPADAGLQARTTEFASVLGRIDGESMTPEERAAQGARDLVSVALVQPALKTFRQSNGAAGPFAPNQAERTFRGMMDASFAQRLVQGGRWGLVDRVARSLLREGPQTSGPATGSATGESFPAAGERSAGA